jgi:translation initiation factor 2B subunit (eIF-2B alpha/beta/delta family)
MNVIKTFLAPYINYIYLTIAVSLSMAFIIMWLNINRLTNELKTSNDNLISAKTENVSLKNDIKNIKQNSEDQQKIIASACDDTISAMKRNQTKTKKVLDNALSSEDISDLFVVLRAQEASND